jgi:hypothetical protein
VNVGLDIGVKVKEPGLIQFKPPAWLSAAAGTQRTSSRFQIPSCFKPTTKLLIRAARAGVGGFTIALNSNCVFTSQILFGKNKFGPTPKRGLLSKLGLPE